ncbi:hypothetical protein N7499_000018 [Penicillium canescens]|uniref:Cyanovirin-N domain-containing protein n=1 Tax=Penicillium canescens TaxID=5083 RepID=A0AAD6IG25_PENCN|nr:uncharacterized protein N7446_011784 [Penicillium canescens]KAJ6003949.1 hypothetical protein N7522_005594 [Penicillium canescens]KAJ6028879.1 hypothetical protein N7444_011866 [Penicillium canescens]KAJ6047311.1 hypothetical protein N7460_003458 [Penicillium canescens]KAJ6049101.1 hypothetical protein N7446_011784 [Penicillium canescens]KAJ6100388.1 hypothetical protein N7499_000018 [Penicillium canescens]
MNATTNLHIEAYGADTYLVGYCMDNHQHWNPSRLRLDACLGDNGGHFQWGGQEFTERARNISFNPEEGGSRAPILRAELQDDAGRYLQGDVNLAERINNRDGYLQFSW